MLRFLASLTEKVGSGSVDQTKKVDDDHVQLKIIQQHQQELDEKQQYRRRHLANLASYNFHHLSAAAAASSSNDPLVRRLPTEKHLVIMMTAEQDAMPISERCPIPKISADDYDPDSAPFYPNGDINFSCPCKSFIVAGPCGYEFRQWALCNHRERLAEEGHKSDDVTTTTTPVDTHKCDRALFEMFQCFEQYPKLFPLDAESINQIED